MSTNHPLSQRTFDRSVELIQGIKDHALERNDNTLWGMADHLDALLRRLVFEIDLETRNRSTTEGNP